MHKGERKVPEELTWHETTPMKVVLFVPEGRLVGSYVYVFDMRPLGTPGAHFISKKTPASWGVVFLISLNYFNYC